MRSFYITKLG